MGMKKRFKNGDKVRVLDHAGFNDKGKGLVGLVGVIVSNEGNGHHSVYLEVDGKMTTAYLPLKALEPATE
jgi:hypothetical protein